MKKYVLLSLALLMFFVPSIAYAASVDISAIGTSGKPGDTVSIEVTMKVSTGSISNVVVRVDSLPVELSQIQKTVELSTILSGEERTASLPIGTSTQTPPGRYKVQFTVTYTDETNTQVSKSGEAFVTVQSNSSSGACCGSAPLLIAGAFIGLANSNKWPRIKPLLKHQQSSKDDKDNNK